MPVTTTSKPPPPPPEGNTTFVDGVTWCVAQPGASQDDVQDALDWACGLGMVDCRPIKPNGACYEPDTLHSHASFAFNSYYQQNGNSDVACNFGGTAYLTKFNPSTHIFFLPSFLGFFFFFFLFFLNNLGFFCRLWKVCLCSSWVFPIYQ